MATIKRVFLSVLMLSSILFNISAPSFVLAEAGGQSYWNVTNLHIYVHKDFDNSSTAIRFKSNQCEPRSSVGQTATCPGVGYFTYDVTEKQGPTDSFPYAIYTKSISRSATSKLPDTNWWRVIASNLDGSQSTRSYSIDKVMNNTIVTFNKDGSTSASAPSGTVDDPTKKTAPGAGDDAPTNDADPAANAEAAGGELGFGFSGSGLGPVGIVSTKCPAGSTTYVNGILKGVSCDGAISTLEEVLAVVKNVVMSLLLPLVGTIFLILLIVGGILYITSRGNAQQVEKAKKTLTAAIAGLIIVTLSYTIVVIFASIIGGEIK